MKFSGVIERFVRCLDFDWVNVRVNVSFRDGIRCCESNVSQVTEGGVAVRGRRFAQRVA